uniref:Protein sleepless n=1 Tax=Arion vulgaris TaxID=1028688 RepID=A0A0B6Y199_9EUPU
MNKFVVVIAALVATFLVVEQSFAIKCFVCNSFHQADCSDWFDNVTQHLVACEDYQQKCRKIVQEVWLEDHWDVRYIRQCAAGGDIGAYEGRVCDEIYGTYNIRVRHCHCDNQDGCNSAREQIATISLALPVLLTFIITLQRLVR